MDKFTVLNGLVAPLDRANVDTDQIIPQKYLQSIKRTGFAEACFAAWRRDPAFVLNQPRYKGAQILLARKNFGIGSSREQAAAALRHLGVSAVIAPSFAGLFFRNAFNLGLLLLTCPGCESIVEGEQIAFDARAGTVTRADGQVMTAEPIPGFLLDMVEAGGLLPQLQRRFQARTTT